VPGDFDFDRISLLRLVRSGFCFVALIGAFFLSSAPPAPAQVRFDGQAGGFYTVNVVSWRDIPFRTVVRQQFDYSCGSAAIATLLRFHYGQSVREAEVFQAMYDRGDQARIRQVGFSMLDMRNYLNARAFQADGLRLSFERLAALQEPTIALITRRGYRHFVVVKGIRDNAVLVGDPTFGLQTYTRTEFLAMWNGVVLAVRHAPAGSPSPIYNDAAEWRPWAVAPLGAVPGPISPADLFREFREIFQITPARTAN